MGLLAYLIVKNSRKETAVTQCFCPGCGDRAAPVVQYPAEAEDKSISGRCVFICRRCGKAVYCRKFVEPALMSPENAYRLCSADCGRAMISVTKGVITAAIFTLAFAALVEYLLNGISPAVIVSAVMCAALAVIRRPAAAVFYEKAERKHALERLEESMRRISEREYLSDVLRYQGGEADCLFFVRCRDMVRLNKRDGSVSEPVSQEEYMQRFKEN